MALHQQDWVLSRLAFAANIIKLWPARWWVCVAMINLSGLPSDTSKLKYLTILISMADGFRMADVFSTTEDWTTPQLLWVCFFFLLLGISINKTIHKQHGSYSCYRVLSPGQLNDFCCSECMGSCSVVYPKLYRVTSPEPLYCSRINPPFHILCLQISFGNFGSE